MTYKQYFKKLHLQFYEAATKFSALDKQMNELDGFANFSTVPKYEQAKQIMLDLEGEIWSLISFVKARGAKPDDLMYSA